MFCASFLLVRCRGVSIQRIYSVWQLANEDRSPIFQSPPPSYRIPNWQLIHYLVWHLLTRFRVAQIIRPWRWTRNVSPKVRWHSSDYMALSMAFSRMLRRMALVRTDVSEERTASIMVTRIGELGTTQCKIWGFHGGDYEECCLLGCYAVWFL
jgi:hypothetical protein